MSKAWNPTNFDEVVKRAAGRRRYHARRRSVQFERRMEVLRELELTSWGTYGMGRALAKKLGVSEATVSRDIQHLRAVRLDQGSEALKALAEFQPYFRESHR